MDEIKTNIGSMPIEDYREIKAVQNGFDSYDDMYNQGYRLGDGLDKDQMTVKRAIEILDPEHREHYASIEPVNRACKMGQLALYKEIPQNPHPDNDDHILACSLCGSGEYLENEDGNRNTYCGQCGQKIDWGDDE